MNVRVGVSRSVAIVALVALIVIVIAGAYIISQQPPIPSETTSPTTKPSPTTPSPTETTPSPSPTSPSPTSPSPTPTETTLTTETTPTPTETTPVETVTPKEEGVVLRVITRHGYDILKVARDMFLKSSIAKQYGIVDVQWLPVDPSQWLEVIRSSAEKPGKEVDVAWGGGPTLFDLLREEGLLAPLTSKLVLKAASKIPDEISGAPMKRLSEEGQLVWVAAAISSFGFTINKDYLEEYGLPTPEGWRDLSSPVYAITLPSPSVGVADPTRSTSNTRMYEIILQDYGWVEGWKIITLMGANAVIYDQSGLVRDAVINREIGVGITIDFYGYTAQIEKPEVCQYIIPSDGSIVNGDPIALLSTSKHPEAAQAFIAWVLTEGQKVWLEKTINRMPANPEIFETEEGKLRADLKQAYERTLESVVIEFSDELALSYEEAMRWFYHATITRAHDKLQNVWSKLALAYLEGKIDEETFKNLIDELANPTKLSFKDPKFNYEGGFTEEYAKMVNEEVKKNPNYRNQMVDIWRKAAEERYDRVLKILEEHGI